MDRVIEYTAASMDTVASGAIAGSATAAQLANISCRMVRFKATAANAGKVYLGAAGVTKVTNGTTDTTTGMQFNAGDDSGWIPIDNLNRFYRISDNVADTLTYIALS